MLTAVTCLCVRCSAWWEMKEVNYLIDQRGLDGTMAHIDPEHPIKQLTPSQSNAHMRRLGPFFSRVIRLLVLFSFTRFCCLSV